MKGLQDDSIPMDKSLEVDNLETLIRQAQTQQRMASPEEFRLQGHFVDDNVEITRQAIHTG